MNILKKITSMLMAFGMLILIYVPVMAAVEEPLNFSSIVSLDYTDVGETSPSGNAAILDGRVSNGGFDGTNGGNRHRLFFLQFDMSVYKNSLDGISSIKLRLYTSSDSGANNSNSKFEVYLLPPEKATKINRDDIATYGDARALDLITYKSDRVWEHTTGLSPSTEYRSPDLIPRLREYFEENPNETVIAFKLLGTNHLAGFAASGGEAPRLVIDVEDPDITRIGEAIGQTTFNNKLSVQDINNVTANLTLPAMSDNGVSISWQTSDSSVISNTGVVTRPAFGVADKIVTLTGTFSYGIYSTNANYRITVLANRSDPGENILPLIDGAYVSSGASGSVMDGSQLICDNGSNKRISFLKFDLSGYEDFGSIKLKLPLFITSINNGRKGIKVYMTDDNDWDSDSLTYTGASNLISDVTNPVCSFTGLFDDDATAFYTDDILPAVSTYFENNPSSDGILTFKIESVAENFIFHGAKAAGDDLKPGLATISRTDAFSETVNYIKQTYAPTVAKVRKDFALPLAWKYSTVEIGWSSNNDAVLDPATGIVTRAYDDVNVTLTATFTSGTRTETAALTIVVLGYGSDPAYFQSVLNSITFNDMVRSVNFTLPTEIDLLPITWTPEDPYVTAVNGGDVTIGRLNERDRTTKITATIFDSGVRESKDFYFTIIRNSDSDFFVKKAVLDETGNKKYAIDDSTDTSWAVAGLDRSITIDISSMKSLSEFLFIYEGSAVSNVKISVSQDKTFVRAYVYNSGNAMPNIANYFKLDAVAYGRYVRLEVPSGVNSVSFFGGYASQSGASDGQLDKLMEELYIPSPIVGNFTLPNKIGGYDYTCISSNTSVVNLSGVNALVTRGTYDTNVRLTVSIVIDGEAKNWIYDRVVIGTGDGGVKPGTGSTGGGSRGGGSPVVVSPEILTPIHSPEPTVNPFNDLDNVKWAEGYINELYKKGIINGKSDGMFAPNDFLKREEMAKLLSEGFSLNSEQKGNPFSDVNSDDWYCKYVQDLYNSSLTSGISENMFGVGLNITRQDTAVLLARLLETKGITAELSSDNNFVDDLDIADYAKNGIYTLHALGIISGDDNGKFNPTANITRAEISKIIFFSLSLLD